MYKAIIVDDEKWIIKNLLATIKGQEYFEIAGEFHSALAALEYIRANQPDLAFVDVKMPQIGGLEILQTAHEEGLRTLFVMISGHAEFAYAQKAMFHNAIGYCLKPFSPSELADTMEKAYQVLEQRTQISAETQQQHRWAPYFEQGQRTQTSAKTQQPDPDRQYLPRHLTSSHATVQSMIQYTGQHYQEDISVQDLADHCCLNASYASRIFKQEMGITFVGYLTQMRIDHAAWLLENTDLNVYVIASQVGYHDYFYFTKVFKKVKGCTPTAYRRNLDVPAGP